ncbi:hybrid sensor histidine kinase/response regulator [Mariprofundus ferrinatatus]|uniref:hybrid sensor histidine kinase/response regulator n=1 Tax=Mariprofundus ferrinatatus TaxID=1921087 RepID=UPI0012FEC0B3|nr:PAS domain-containing hybrid sensor histidine kinase/response regulator [Mariprofundus ferrinatatus]
MSKLNPYEEKLRALYDASPDTIMFLNEHGILDCNPATLKMFACTSSEEFLGRHLSEHSPPIQPDGRDSRTAADEQIAAAYRSGSNIFEWTHQKTNGEVFPAEVHLTLLKLKDGDILHATTKEISDRKKTATQFNQSQKMEALGTLVGGIAHDFNNILGGIVGNLFLAMRKLQDQPRALANLNNIEKLSDRAADMIQQLLTFARTNEVEKEHFSLTSFLKEAVKLTEAAIPESTIVTYEFCNQELTINADATQLHQVLLNLIINAQDAVAERPEPRIIIRLDEFEVDEHFINTHPDASSDYYAHVRVSDNGTGIRQEDIAHVLDPFFTTKEVGKGTGLGLAMVHRAIQEHNGILNIESKENQGTTIHLYLPLIAEEEQAMAAYNETEIEEGEGETILLVDDEADLLETTQGVLENLGYHVLTAADGLEAVDIFSNNQGIALVIMDVVMPRLGGSRAALRMREINPDIPIIFATGYDKKEALRPEERIERSLVMRKPLDIDTLSHRIKEIIR